jgi:hypothetical protein
MAFRLLPDGSMVADSIAEMLELRRALIAEGDADVSDRRPVGAGNVERVGINRWRFRARIQGERVVRGGFLSEAAAEEALAKALAGEEAPRIRRSREGEPPPAPPSPPAPATPPAAGPAMVARRAPGTGSLCPNGNGWRWILGTKGERITSRTFATRELAEAGLDAHLAGQPQPPMPEPSRRLHWRARREHTAESPTALEPPSADEDPEAVALGPIGACSARCHDPDCDDLDVHACHDRACVETFGPSSRAPVAGPPPEDAYEACLADPPRDVKTEIPDGANASTDTPARAPQSASTGEGETTGETDPAPGSGDVLADHEGEGAAGADAPPSAEPFAPALRQPQRHCKVCGQAGHNAASHRGEEAEPGAPAWRRMEIERLVARRRAPMLAPQVRAQPDIIEESSAPAAGDGLSPNSAQDRRAELDDFAAELDELYPVR